MNSSADVDVRVAYRLFGLHDGEVDETPPSPAEIGHPWLSAGTSAVVLQSVQDIFRARVHFEAWDARPEPDDEQWPGSAEISLWLPSGSLSVHQIAAGSLPDVFRAGPGGRYGVRLAWRALAWDPDAVGPQALVLAQFWPADRPGAAD